MTTEGNSHLKLKMVGDVLALRATMLCLHASGSECLLQSDMCLKMEMGCGAAWSSSRWATSGGPAM